MSTSVLAHIARTVAQKENLATDVLAFILNRSPSARRAMNGQIAALVGTVPPIAHATCQTVVGEESRPDILLSDERGKPVGYVEAKFWAGLTDAQPMEYVKRLAEAGGGVLVVLAPDRRLVTLRAELIERLKGVGVANLRDRSLECGTVRVALISWAAILHALRDAVVEDRGTASDVHQLEGLVARFEAEGFVPFTRAELDNLDVPRRAVTLLSLTDEIVAAGVADGLVKRAAASIGLGFSGRYVNFERACAWFGVSYFRWSLHGGSPLWLTFGPGWGSAEALLPVLAGWVAADPPRAYILQAGGSIRVPVTLPAGREKDEVVAAVIAQFRELDLMMRTAGMPVRKGTPAPPASPEE